MDVSIIIPVYNAEKTIKRCIDSVCKTNQKFYFEVIAIDDGSKDDSLKILKKYEKRYKNLKVIHQDNNGVSMARNKGIEISKGKWIMFLDADDYFEENWGKLVMKFITSNCPFIVFTKKVELETNLKDVVSMILGLPRYEFIGRIHSKMFYSKYIRENKILFRDKIINGEDMLFCLEYYLKVKQILFVEADFYFYDINEMSATHRYNEKQLQSDIKFHNELSKILDNIDDKESFIAYCLLNNLILFFRRYSYKNAYSEEEILKFINNPMFKNVLNRYKSYFLLFSLPKRIILYIIKKKKYNLLVNLFKIKNRLKNK